MSSRVTAEGSTLADLANTPAIQASQIGAGGIGAIADSVNLFRGDVNLPLDLLSLPGRGGLVASISLVYQSNVQHEVDTWNLQAPTGLVGLGWSLPYDMIAIDNKNNASLADDAYYLFSGGAANRLYKTGSDGDEWVFELENYQFWDIRYDTTAEVWTIVKEDGNRHVYGGQASDPARSPLQYGIRWAGADSDWVGSSTETSGQQQFALAWNLAAIENPWGDRISFAYENSLATIGNTDGKQYTRDSRLQAITDPYGKTATFAYGDKTYSDAMREYQIPHQDPNSSNAVAYQDRYGTQFLQSIAVANPAAGGQPADDLLFTIEFAYELANIALDHQGDADFYKRYLTGIVVRNRDGRTLPGTKFSYYNDPQEDLDDQTHRGALKTITYPEGGVGTYTYDKVPLGATARAKSIPLSGTPRVWFGADYAVVAQCDPDGANSLKIYSWNGSWVEDPASTSLAHQPDIDSLQVSAQGDFFALSYATGDDDEPQMMVYLFHKAKGAFGTWDSAYDTLAVDPDQGGQTLLAGGSGFVVACASGGQALCKVWDVPSSSWIDRSGDFGVAAGNRYALAAFGNYFALAAYDASAHRCSVALHYLDATTGRIEDAGLADDTIDDVYWHDDISPGAFWSLGADYAAATYIANDDQDAGYGVRVYQWDGDFNAGVAVERSYADQPFAYSVASGSIVGNAGDLLRFDGVEWQSGALDAPGGDAAAARFAYGSGLAVVADDSGHAVMAYSPYLNEWGTAASPTASGDARPTVNNDFLTIGSSAFYRDGEGGLTAAGSLGADIEPNAVFNAAPYFIAYQDTGGNTHIAPVQNGELAAAVAPLAGEKIYVDDQGRSGTALVGPHALATYKGDDFAQATSLTLYWVIDGAAEGPLYDFPVAQLEIDDGYQTRGTLYKYDTGSAVLGPDAVVTEYAAATMIPGASEADPKAAYPAPTQTPFGKTEFTYCVGQTAQTRQYYDFLRGTLLGQTVYDAAGDKVAATVNTPYPFTRRADIDDAASSSDLYGVYVRTTKQENTLYAGPLGADAADADAVTQTVEYDYSAQTGLLSGQTTYNYNAEGTQDALTQSRRYGWEQYEALKDGHVWSPVVQAINFTNGEPTAIAVTTWQQWYDDPDLVQWAPRSNYRARTPDVYDDASGALRFDDWDNDDPPPADDWLKVSENVGYAEAGAVIERLDIDQVASTALLDAAGERTVAEFANASRDAVSYIGFESYEQPQGWSVSGGSQSLDDCILAGDAHTGAQSLRLPPDQAAALENRLTLGDATGVYVLSCWLKTPGGFGADGEAAWAVSVDGADIAVWPIDGTDGAWQYRNYAVDLGAYAAGTSVTLRAYNHSAASDLYLLLDDIFFAPLAGGAGATVYDPVLDLPTAQVDFSGKTFRTFYDAFQRPVAAIGPCENTNAAASPYLTRQANDADPFAFPQDEPNSALTVTAQAGGPCADLVNGAEWADAWSSDSMDHWAVAAGALVHTQAAADSIAFAPTEGAADYGARVSVRLPLDAQGAPVEPQHPIGMRIGALTAQWAPDSGWSVGTDAPAGDGGAFGCEWLLVATSDALLFYADGRQVFAQRPSQAVAGALELFVEDADVAFANIAVLQNPRLGIAYSDGAGQQRQTQALNGADCLIAATCYDELGRADIATKAAQRPDALFGYDGEFVTGVDADTGVMAGYVATYYSGDEGRADDEGYPYYRTAFETSPLARPVRRGLPGKDFAITGDNPHVAAIAYGTNVEGAFGGDSCPSGEYYVCQTTDADGVPTYTLSNQLGQTVATKTGPTGAEKIAQYHYDSSGNLLRVLMPNYFAPPAGAATGDAWVIARDYDFLGRMTAETTPDSGTTQYIYDQAGRTRFMLDAQGADPAQGEDSICYNKYDSLGRLIEDGFFAGAWGDGGQLQDKADNDPDWPDASQPHTWLHQYDYDGDGSDPDAIGLLVATRSSAADVDEEYRYDGYGNAVAASVSGGGYDAATRTVAYAYDNLGDITRITYPDGSQVAAVAYSYDPLGQLTGVGTPDDPTAFAAVTYTADGAPGAATLGGALARPVQRTLGYNPPGWPVAIQDIFTDDESTALDQAFTYTSGGYGGAGYYGGALAGASLAAPDGDAYDYQYQHDDLGRIEVAQNTAQSDASLGVAAPLAYDANGNILALARGQTQETYSYAADSDQVAAVAADGAAVDAYGYNLNGDVTSAQRRDIAQVDYDPLSRLTTAMQLGADSGAAQTLSFAYGGGGQRIVKALSDDAGAEVAAKLYVRGLNAYPLIEEARQGGASQQTQYIYGPGGLLALCSGGACYTVLGDNEGSVRRVLDAAGAVVAAFDYMPFGELIDAPGGSDPDLVTYRYTGQEYDAETQLYNYRARFYDPRLGRFYAVDPAGQYFNPYSYAGDDPVDRVDPDGQWAALVAVAAGTAIGAVGGAISAGVQGKSITSNGFWQEVGIGAAAGAAGALAATGAGALAAGFGAGSLGIGVVSGVVGGAVQGATAAALQGEDDNGIALAAGINGAIGGFSGYAGARVAGSYGNLIPQSTGKAVGASMALGATIGAAGGFAGELGMQLADDEEGVDWGAVGSAAGLGAATGALTSGLSAYVAMRGGQRANNNAQARSSQATRSQGAGGRAARRGPASLSNEQHRLAGSASTQRGWVGNRARNYLKYGIGSGDLLDLSGVRGADRASVIARPVPLNQLDARLVSFNYRRIFQLAGTRS